MNWNDKFKHLKPLKKFKILKYSNQKAQQLYSRCLESPYYTINERYEKAFATNEFISME